MITLISGVASLNVLVVVWRLWASRDRVDAEARLDTVLSAKHDARAA